MAKKDPVNMSVVTLPLKTEIWQRDRLDKLMGLYANTYNATLSVALKNYNAMLRNEEYKEANEIIMAAYKATDPKAAKKTPEYKAAVDKAYQLRLEYKMTEFGFSNLCTQTRQHFKENLSSSCVGRSIAKPMYAAFEKMMFSNGRTVHYKKARDFNSICSDCKSGVRIVNEEGETVYTRVNNEKLYVVVGSGKKRKMTIPIIIPEKDIYKAEMLCREYKTARILRRTIKGKSRYYIQLGVMGAPAEKVIRETGEIKHPVGQGVVGLYIDTRELVLSSEKDGIKIFDLSEGIPSYEEERNELLTYMDTSRRLANPDNYNEDGTIKKGIMKDGKRTRLKWVSTENYKKAKAQLSELYRIESEQRQLQRHILANKVIEYGDVFVVNNYPFEYAARRKEEQEFTKTGGYASKKKAGKTIGQNAPAMFVQLLDSMLIGKGKDGVYKVDVKDLDYNDPNYKANTAVLLREGKL